MTKDKKIMEYSLRLINSIASDFSGRSYLVQSNNLISILINILRNEKGDTDIRRNVLGAL